MSVDVFTISMMNLLVTKIAKSNRSQKDKSIFVT